MSWRDDLIKLPRGFTWADFDVRRNTVILHCNRGLWAEVDRDSVTCGKNIPTQAIRALCEGMAASDVRGWCTINVRRYGEEYRATVEPRDRPAHMYHQFDPDDPTDLRYTRRSMERWWANAPPQARMIAEALRNVGPDDVFTVINGDDTSGPLL